MFDKVSKYVVSNPMPQERRLNRISIIMLLNELIKDEKIDKILYSSGLYWDYKNRRTIHEIKRKGLKNLVITTGIGTFFDN